MTGASHRLGELQRWMLAVITHPSGIESGIASAEARQQIDVMPGDVRRIVKPSKAMTSVERLAVYGNAYYARLLECMRELFPVLVEALGTELFDEFAYGYLQAYPPCSYTLGHLADNFVSFLEQTRPTGGDSDWSEFIVDLARLEWTIDLVFDGPGVEREPLLDPATLTEIHPARWAEAKLVPVCCLKLLPFQFPVNDYFTAVRLGQQPSPPGRSATYLALSRRDYVVRRYDLSRPQYDLLATLAEGKTVREAITRAAESFGDVDAFAESLENWFHQWSAQGFFQNVRWDDASM